ncbi:uncharacterized protein APUU_11456A [Aspergillus puulaauensis]|uniref:MARVEL domain-containing protein n=1 Tax=Aspergillus puulaauensis TaxID=1220207 RepID=A0A7R7XCC2_9EURO|nr:uncharacterized protein APUU_11456A [Aspergillus puulaauensis]BCS18628.1 hypothetical protein APUU_11456A [Aspergillus puulaauensis]
MGSIIRNLWSAETPGPRTVVRVLDAAIATLGVATIWSTLISFLTYNDRLFHPGFHIALDFALAAVHYVFGIVNALAADTAGYMHGNAIAATFLLIIAVLHTFFFVLACRDTHVRRRVSGQGTHKDGFEVNTV